MDTAAAAERAPIKRTLEMSSKCSLALQECLAMAMHEDFENILGYLRQLQPIPKTTELFIINDKIGRARKLLDNVINMNFKITDLYRCFEEAGQKKALEVLEGEYPTEKLACSSSEDESSASSVCSSSVTAESTTSPSSSAASSCSASTEMIQIYESLLPVVHESDENRAERVSGVANSNTFFEIIEVSSRKLKFKMKMFHDESHYLKELEAVKYRHLNLLTAECIYKSLEGTHFHLLYSHSGFNSILLNEYGNAIRRVKSSPAEFDVKEQLEIVRDVACGLYYLHDRTDHKTEQILHGNLQPEFVLIETNEQQTTAKLFNFTNVHVNRAEFVNEAKTKDELFKLGMLIFFVTCWKQISKSECDEIHKDEPHDNNTYLLKLFEKYGLKTQPRMKERHTLFSMFYKLTSPKCDPNKDLQDCIKRIEKHIAALEQKTDHPSS